MIKSMTGFSKAEFTEEGMTASVEIKSLNGRYLELNCKMPRSLQHKENDVREMVRKYINRGTVSVNITLELESIKKIFSINNNVVNHIHEQLNDMRKDLKMKEAIKIEHILNFSSYFIESNDDEDSNKQMSLIRKVLGNALRNLDQMRRKEGQTLIKDLNNRMKIIIESVDKIEKLGIQRIPAERDKLKQRLAQFFENDEYDEQRLQLEMVLMADKLDISEEVVRLKSHFKFYYEILKNEEAPGRKINFLLQEIHREINTIGSKANDAQISQYVVNIKEELEKIREQIQNIE